MSANTVPFPVQSRLFGKYFEYSRYNDVVRAMHGMLAGITGMGSAKIEHYGAELLALIGEFA